MSNTNSDVHVSLVSQRVHKECPEYLSTGLRRPLGKVNRRKDLNGSGPAPLKPSRETHLESGILEMRCGQVIG